MATVVHFDIAADDPKRAKEFYNELFNWEINLFPGPVEYYLFETAGLGKKPGAGGGIAKRDNPKQGITNFVGVDSVDDYLARVEELGGKIVEGKMAVPGWGYMAVCLDTEGNRFGLWQEDRDAK